MIESTSKEATEGQRGLGVSVVCDLLAFHCAGAGHVMTISQL